ncbi:MAG: cysteine synthase A [Oscillospiraceae bacterium]
MIFESMQELIGNTPLVRIKNYEKLHGVSAKILVKLEFLNPTGSAKDRAAKYLLDDAEKSGKLKQGGVIIEPTSGNTGIALAAEAAERGYKAIFTMPESMSIERRRLISAYGAEIVLTSAALGMQGAVDKANELLQNTENAFIPGQFTNPANPAAHYATTGPEIWRDTQGEIDAFIAGVGTGGTLSGTGKYLKEQNPNVRVIAVQPAKSPVLTGGKPSSHGIMGIGANFVPLTLDTSIYNEVMDIQDDDAYAAMKSLAKCEGVLVGISSGAALAAAVSYGKRAENKGKLIVVLLPDSGERYLSTPAFAE